MSVRIINADVLQGLAQLEDESVQCCVTSPPYWGLRDYGVSGQIGLEPTPDAFVAKMVEVFREVRRVLRKDGVLFLNLGDSYAMSTKGSSGKGEKQITNAGTILLDRSWKIPTGLKPKDLVGIPWMVAFALRADGWYLRQEIIWAKPNPMPESVRDRCTKAHEHIFLLSKAERYFYDAGAIQEDADPINWRETATARRNAPPGQATDGGFLNGRKYGARNKRSVWTVATTPYSEAHFATFPEEIPEICIKAGSRIGDTILDPFGGAGTTGLVADKLGRHAVLIELNSEYAAMAERRIRGDCPMFADVQRAE